MPFVNDLHGRKAAAFALAFSLAAWALACLPGCTSPVSGGSATLTVHIQPPDSVVYVDCRCDYGSLCDNAVGSDVRSFRGLSASVAVVRAERDGYETWEASVPIKPGENSVKVTLQRGDRGRLSVSSDVDGAEVYVDGALAGHSPLVGYMMAAGRHSLEIAARGTRWKGSVWGFGWGQGGAVPGDLTVVQADLAEGWTLVGYPPNRLATEYGNPSGWTPDGARVVFSGRGIKLVDMETLDVQDTGIIAWSAYDWSPDGSLLVFHSEGLAGIMNAVGAEVRTYRYADAGVPPMTSLVSWCPWHPDGRHLLLQTGDSPSYWLLDLATGKAEPFVKDIIGKYSKQSVTIRGFTKDGDPLIEVRSFVRKDGSSGYAESGYFADIGILDGQTAEIRLLTQADESQYYTPIGLTPDGRFAYFKLHDKRQGPEAATSTYGTVSLEDGSIRPAVSGGASICRAWWSPDDKELLYVAERTQARGVLLMIAEADGAHPRVLFTVPNLGMSAELSIANVQWSTDGTRLYIRDSGGVYWFGRKHSSSK